MRNGATQLYLPMGLGKGAGGPAARAALEAAGSRGPSEPSALPPPSSTSLVSPRPAADGFLEVWVMAPSHEASPQRPTPLGVQGVRPGEKRAGQTGPGAAGDQSSGTPTGSWA